MKSSACLLSVVTIATTANFSFAEPLIMNVPPAKIDWAETPEGVAFGPLIGNRFKEPYMAMVRLPAGLVSPAHTKSADMFGVLVSGAMTHIRHGEDTNEAVVLPAGSFYRIPANVPHVSSCVSEEECITFLYQDGKFDFLPVEQ